MSTVPGGNSGMKRVHGNASLSMNSKAVEALDGLVENLSDGSGSSSSPSSSGGSTSRTGYGRCEAGPTTASRSSFSTDSFLHGTDNAPSAQMRRMAVNGISPSASMSTLSSATNHIRTAAEYSTGSPQKLRAPHRLQANTELEPRHGLASVSQGQPRTPRRDTLINQASPMSRSGRASFSSPLRTPTLFHDPNAPSLTGIPEILAVQEMAFRQGQHDSGVTRDRVPSSPFAKHFDQVWIQFYVFGKEYGGKPIASLAASQGQSSHQNFPWPVLINPYTQDLEHPNGAIDAEWVRKVCTIALNCMQALIRTVCTRQGDWRKVVCDVPTQIKQALMGFDDLRKRYESLKQDAHEAVAGGLPQGY
ncbi:hypothetical protein FB567DRAFT_596421 [Paraphoma chrysanthemicola]|uniref:Uncharacterized protein n=1 Tax=Paraphoma chrysanthemicola TaxID=798071 RepID=A0A8K0QY08_9PLEO|nr:hypothetical protein FB567DRAFT_596421 [Paraphoma chrysanthemicola]